MLIVSFALVISAASDEFRLPSGFSIVEVAGPEFAHDCYVMTLDPQGRLTVSSRNYIRIVDHRGAIPRATTFFEGPRDGANGLCWVDHHLYVVGNGGLWKLSDADGDDRADGPPKLIVPLKTGNEHATHAVGKGPDGLLYVLCGDNSNIGDGFATDPSSPISRPIAGVVLRMTESGERRAIVADGFRNPYGMDWNEDGELFVYDSDNERCVSLPWYEGTRLYHIVDGSRHGWLGPKVAPTWRRPPYWIDLTAPIVDLGRGSPTGVACYRHRQFPPHYQQGVFLLDWTFGRIHFVALRPKGASYEGRNEVFLEPSGTNGFAPTAAVVDPNTGDLYVSTGGRGTRGAVFRIRHDDRFKQLSALPAAARPSTNAPNDASRAALNDAPSAARRRRREIARLADTRPLPPLQDRMNAVQRDAGSSDPVIRPGVARIIANLPSSQRSPAHRDRLTTDERLTWGLGLADVDPKQSIALVLPLTAREVDARTRLNAVRTIQRAMGDVVEPSLRAQVWAGYSARTPELIDRAIVRSLVQFFPSNDWALDREITRLFAMARLADPGLVNALLERISPDSEPVDDEHFLIVLGRIEGSRSADQTARTARALLDLDSKFDRRRGFRDRNWPFRITELVEGLIERDPALAQAIVSDSTFGRPDHAILVQAKGIDRRWCAERLLARSKEPGFKWSAGFVEIIDALPIEIVRPVFHSIDSSPGVADAVLRCLARRPSVEDRSRFIAALRNSNAGTAQVALDGWEKLPPERSEREATNLYLAWRHLPDEPELTRIKERIARGLTRSTELALSVVDRARWLAALDERYPKSARDRAEETGVDRAEWKRRFAAVDWKQGDRTRGERLFRERQCAACHAGVRSLGPDLAGVGKRFSREDLFLAITDPNHDVPDRYRTLIVTTHSGDVLQGLEAYSAADSLLLQVSPDRTVRVPVEEIAGQRRGRMSLMPVGLLDKCSDRDLADLDAHLQSLAAPGG